MKQIDKLKRSLKNMKKNRCSILRTNILRPVEEMLFRWPPISYVRKMVWNFTARAEADRLTRGLNPDDIAHFSSDKPRKCKDCYWFDPVFGCCSGKRCAYYIPLEVYRSPCLDCSYAKDHPCIGFCMKEVLTKDYRKEPYVVKWIE